MWHNAIYKAKSTYVKSMFIIIVVELYMGKLQVAVIDYNLRKDVCFYLLWQPYPKLNIVEHRQPFLGKYNVYAYAYLLTTLDWLQIKITLSDVATKQVYISVLWLSMGYHTDSVTMTTSKHILQLDSCLYIHPLLWRPIINRWTELIWRYKGPNRTRITNHQHQ